MMYCDELSMALVGGWEVLPPHFNLFPSESWTGKNAYGCYDANLETKSGKILRIFHYQARAVTILPPLQESRPEILGLSEEGGIFLTKASFTFPGRFFFGMVRPLDFEELDGLVAGFPLRFIQDADRMLAIGQILLDV